MVRIYRLFLCRTVRRNKSGLRVGVETKMHTLEASVEHLKPGRSEIDVLYELLLKLGLDLCVPVEKRIIAGKEVHSVGGGVLIACLATRLDRKDVEPLHHRSPPSKRPVSSERAHVPMMSPRRISRLY